MVLTILVIREYFLGITSFYSKFKLFFFNLKSNNKPNMKRIWGLAGAAAGVLPKLINLHGWPHPARRARLRIVVVCLPRSLVDGRDPLRRVEVRGHGRGGRGRRGLHELA